jgi:Ulp1 family protease
LRNYLEREWFDKKGEKIQFKVKSYIPKVPYQMNSTDCGMFIIKYLIKFTQSLPIDFSDSSTVNSKIGKNWFQLEEIEKLRYQIRATITLLSN